MKTKNIITLIMLVVSITLATAILSLVPNSKDGLPAFAFIPHVGGLIVMCLYSVTFPEEGYPRTMTRAEGYEYRRNSWIFRALYHPFIFMGVWKYLERNEWEKSEVLLACLEASYDPHQSPDFDEHKIQLEVGEHIKRLQKRIPVTLGYVKLLEMINYHRRGLLELESNLKRHKNRKKYRNDILDDIKAVQAYMLEYEVLLATEKKRKTEAYKRIVLINLNKSLK
jgi:hypothetical protein